MSSKREEEQEFEYLIDRHRASIYHICKVYFPKNKYLQESLYSDIIYHIWKGKNSFRNESSEHSWIYRIAINTAINHYHCFAKTKKNIAITTYIEETLTSEQDNILISELYELIEQLNSIEKAIIYLYLDKIPQAEIGKILGLSQTNISTIISRIKIKLRNLKEYELRNR